MLDKINPIGLPQKKDELPQGLGSSGANAAFLSSAQPSIFDNTGVIPNGENLKIGDYLNGQKTA